MFTTKAGNESDPSAPKTATTTGTTDADGVKAPAKTEVTDPANLTDDEKAKVEEEVKKVNPNATDVTVDKDGTTTVTFPDGSKATLTPDKTVEQTTPTPSTPDADGVKDPAKTPVVDPSNLTDAEKEKVKDEVKKANPTATDVTVDKDGTATVTFPDGSKATLTPDKTVVKANEAGTSNSTRKADKENLSTATSVNGKKAAMLPNTGTKESAGMYLAAMMTALTGGFLLGAKRKKKDEE